MEICSVCIFSNLVVFMYSQFIFRLFTRAAPGKSTGDFCAGCLLLKISDYYFPILLSHRFETLSAVDNPCVGSDLTRANGNEARYQETSNKEDQVL